ncbi:hypothetical protein ACSBOB_20415 [Mesorhizobium sp. ASY16-5R]|uniref:hypothetical protein n=1 Tax=Mesorhizobium sp. ASY16-5R TaxID=3445772 RepID=UPI003FA10AC3
MARNPFSLDTYFNIDRVADAMLMLWREGSRHPRLGHEIRDLFAGLTLAVYNEAADLAWSRLTPEERREASEEAGGADGTS